MHTASPIFVLPAEHPATINPALIARDEESIARITASVQLSIDTLTARLNDLRHIRTSAGDWQQASDRDTEIRSVTARLTVLQRYGRDSCLGRIVRIDGTIVYIGRVGLLDSDGEQLLIDWRTPEAEPFFSATQAQSAGVESRRRYRWSRGVIVDFWDEVFTDGDPDGQTLTEPVAPDEDSAFIASLAAGRSPRMRDVLGTIASDQDAAIRADSRGALVIDGGPGTGKTVVALHRAAYLLYADTRLRGHRGGVLVVGPHDPYLGYVSDVLPNLGTDGVRLCTPNDVVRLDEVTDETDPVIARLKGTVEMIDGIERAARFYEEPPKAPLTVEAPWGEVTITADDWAEAFDAASDVPHNEGREHIWATLTAIVEDSFTTTGDVRKVLESDDALTTLVNRSWPILDPFDVVGDLWTVPAFLRLCVPSLSTHDVQKLQRGKATDWTTSDIPLLDAARRRFGDPTIERRTRRRAAVLAAQRQEMDDVVSHLIDSQEYDDGEGLMSMLRQGDLRDVLVDENEVPRSDPEELAGPFAHIIVDEAQELTDAQWRMLLARCPSGSMTIVGDRAQARRGFSESWAQRLSRVGLGEIRIAHLTVNYRAPAEIMAAAEPVIRRAIPDANVPASIRESGIPVRHINIDDVESVVTDWLAANSDGTVCVIGDANFVERPRVRSLSPEQTKGLEFDLVILVRPNDFGEGITGAVDLYVAMTRATSQLVVAE